MLDIMKEIIQSPESVIKCILDFKSKFGIRLHLSKLQTKHFSKILNIIFILQFWHSSRGHEHEQIDQSLPMLPNIIIKVTDLRYLDKMYSIILYSILFYTSNIMSIF